MCTKLVTHSDRQLSMQFRYTIVNVYILNRVVVYNCDISISPISNISDNIIPA
jgi:hypothetical protein